jgi:hypothetical protein
MARRGEKFSKNVHVVVGGLHGYCVHCSARSRHASLATTVREDGYGTAEKRLNYIRNLNEHRPSIHRIMSRDVRWLKKNYGTDRVRRE